MKNFLSNFRIIEIEIKGVGFGSLLNMLARENVHIISTKRLDNTTLKIKIYGKYAPVTFAILKKRCYNYIITKNLSLGYTQFGVIIGCLLALIIWCVLAQFCFGIKVNSDDENLVEKINSVLASHNYSTFRTFGSLDFNEIENTLRNEIDDLGLVNVSRRGAYLWINCNAVTPPIENNTIENTTGVFATTNGVVSRIFVHSGTALVREGDTVSMGQMLIAPYYLDNNDEPVASLASGEVYLFVWDSATVEFREIDQAPTRTGRTETSTRVLFNDDVLSDDAKTCSFDSYEVETKIKYLSQIIPVKIEYTTYYETELVTVNREYSAERDALIYEARERALSMVNESEILDERYTESMAGDTYYVTYYLKREIKV